MVDCVGRSLICVCKVTHYFSNTKAFSVFFYLNVDFIHTSPIVYHVKTDNMSLFIRVMCSFLTY